MARARLYEAFQVADTANRRDVFFPASSVTISVCQLGTTTPVTFPIYDTATGSHTVGPSNITVSAPYTLELYAKVPDRVTLAITLSGTTVTQTSAFVFPEGETLNKFSPVLYGAKFDATLLTDGVLGVGTTALQSASAVFTPDDVTKRVVVERAGPTATYLQTRVATYASAGQVTLARTATKTVSGATFYVKGRAYTDGAMTAGSAVLTSASNPFAATDDDNGGVVVFVAGASTLPLCTTISAYVSPTQVTLAANASTSITAAGVWYGTDDSAAIQAAIDAAALAGGGGQVDGGGTCYPPLGRAMVATGIVVGGQATSLYGVGAFAEPGFTQHGTTLIAATLNMTLLEVAGNNNEVRGIAIDGAFKAAQFGIKMGSASHTINHDGIHENIKVDACQTGVLLDYEHFGTEFRSVSVKHCDNGIVGQQTGGLANQKVTFHNVRSEENVIGGTLTACELFTFENGTFQFNGAGGLSVTNCRDVNLLCSQFEGNGRFAVNLAKPADNSATPALVGGFIAGNRFIGGDAAGQVGIQSNGSTGVAIGANSFEQLTAGAVNFTVASGGFANADNVFWPYQRIESTVAANAGAMNGITYGWDRIIGSASIKAYYSLEKAFADNDPRTAELIWRTNNPNAQLIESGRMRVTTTSHSGETSPRSKIEFLTAGSPTAVPGEHLAVTIPEDGGMVVGRGAALARSATNGFLYVPWVTGGFPTGTPDTYISTGAVPMVVDADESKLCVYLGGAWRSVTLS